MYYQLLTLVSLIRKIIIDIKLNFLKKIPIHI